jgi:hypothetical protein
LVDLPRTSNAGGYTSSVESTVLLSLTHITLVCLYPTAPAGVNIFLSRPFVVGDQVMFAGGSDLEGTVEAVEIMRTLLRTTGEGRHASSIAGMSDNSIRSGVRALCK